uniref:INCENP_ARK-bind domain-containing protein n=1 Tax=Globodera pallida TaxID=36090 RepID=A0A183CRE5_GLOPA
QKPLLAPDEQKIREEEERKKKLKEEEERKKKLKEEEERKKKLKEEEERKKKQKEEEERKKKQKEEEERKKKLKEEEERKKKQKAEEERKTALEDKSAQRKSTLNMREDDRVKAEQAEKESARQKARSSGAVGEAAKQYNETTEDSFAYKRSKALEPKPMDQQKPKRTFKPIQKPDPKAEEAFEKQMAELREQMRQGSRKLQSEFRDVSQGLKSASDDAKLKTKEVQHRSVMDKASSAFGKAEQEKRRLREIQESEAERAKREKGEKERREHENREKEKAAQTAAKPEPKRTVRRAAKEQIAPQGEDAKKGEEETTRAPPKAKSYWERGTRRKTEELMKFKGTPTVGQAKAEETTKTDVEVPQPKNQPSETKPDEGRSELRRKNRRRCTRRGHRRRPFTRAPFDIDELLDWRGLDTFEKMESFFASRGAEKRPISALTNGGAPAAKRRGTEAQKVWISDLMDIDKLYKASELRD